MKAQREDDDEETPASGAAACEAGADAVVLPELDTIFA